MKRIAGICALLLLLSLGGCVGAIESQGTVSPKPHPSGNYNWGTDATCSPGCPAGQSGSW